MKIVSVHDGGGCGWYRLVVPLTELGKHGHDVTLAKAGSEVHAKLDGKGYDVVAGQRFDNFNGTASWRRLRSGSNRLVYDNDDDVFSIDKSNTKEAFEAYTKLTTRAAVVGYLTYSDLVTTTNHGLAEKFEDRGAVSTAVMPNFIPRWVLELPRAPRNDLRIGYMGAASHGEDLELAAPQVRKFAERNRDWSVNVVGTDFRTWFKMPAGQISLTEWVSIGDNPKGFYESLDFDIGIAPLKNTNFTQSKSYIKALEYNARGIPVIASDVAPYRDYIRHGVNGFLVKQPHEWGKYLNLLANDHELRHQMSKKSKEVATQYTIEENWKLWETAYEGLFK